MNARKPILLLAVLVAACDSTSPVADESRAPDPLPQEPAAARQLLPGEPRLLTVSGDDWWPRIEGDHLAWYRNAPADEQGLWRMDLTTGEAERVWAGSIDSPFALRDGRVYWGADDALRVHDADSGAVEILSDQWVEYGWIDVSDRYVTGIARVGSDRPFYLDRSTGEEAWIPAPTAVPAAHGWGEYISWTDRRDGLRIGQHFLLHIPTGTEVRVTDQGELLSAANAELENGRLAYFDRRYCPGNVSVYDLEDATTTVVPLGVDCPTVAALQGDLLVTHHPSPSWPGLALAVRDLVTGEAAEIPVVGNATRRIDADLDGTRLVYTTAAGLALVDLAPPPPPVADAGGPYRGLEGDPLLLDASESSTATGAAGTLDFWWSFGDGAAADGPQVEHSWVDDGWYTATVTVTDGLGRSTSATAPVEILNVAPKVEANTLILPARMRVTAGSPLVLRPAFSDPGAEDGPWSWAVFANGARVASGNVAEQGVIPDVAWSPEAAGDWTVRVEVMDADGGLGGAEMRVLVGEPEPEFRVIRLWAGSGSQNAAPAWNSNGRLPIVLMGSGEIPVGRLDPASFRAGPAGAEPMVDGDGIARMGDFNGDGFPDMLLHFRMRDTGLARDDTEICLHGQSEIGEVRGCSPIRIGGS